MLTLTAKFAFDAERVFRTTCRGRIKMRGRRFPRARTMACFKSGRGYLLEKRADANATDMSGKTPLFYADDCAVAKSFWAHH